MGVLGKTKLGGCNCIKRISRVPALSRPPSGGGGDNMGLAVGVAGAAAAIGIGALAVKWFVSKDKGTT